MCKKVLICSFIFFNCLTVFFPSIAKAESPFTDKHGLTLGVGTFFIGDAIEQTHTEIPWMISGGYVTGHQEFKFGLGSAKSETIGHVQ